MPGVVELPVGAAARPFDLGFSVGHQKVELEIDLASKTLKGRTEITIHPRRRDLGTIWLNFRQGEVKQLSVNGKPATTKYTDHYESLQLYLSLIHI